MNFNNTKLILTLSLTLLIHPSTLVLAQNSDYEAGQKAMHNHHYQEAYEHFKAAESDKKYTDASLYWQIYVLFKNKQDAKAKRTLKKLLKNHPNSHWINDAEILAYEHQIEEDQSNADYLEKELERLELNEELKLYAIQQLLHENPAKGLPLVKQLIKNSTDTQVKSNALQLLGISESKEASKYLYDYILQEQEFKLKNQAIEMLSLRSNPLSNKLLMQLYEENDNRKLKSTIIQGFIHSDDHNKLLKLIKKEKDLKLSAQMIHILGVMGAQEALKKLSNSAQGTQNKSALIQALALSGDSKTIKKMIENNDDQQSKIEAIHSLIVLDDPDTQSYLFDLYNRLKNVKLKREVISVFIATNTDSGKILELIEQEKNQQLNLALIETLMVLGDKKSLLQLLKTKSDNQSQQHIIQMLGVMGATAELKQIYENTINNNNKKQIIEAVGLNDSGHSEDFLFQVYGTENSQLKKSVIHAFMLQNNAQALMKLLKQETHDSLKKEIIRTIGLIDSEYLLEKLNKNLNQDKGVK